MPKGKTRKSIAKRVKVTGTGRLFRRKPGSGHLKSRKTSKQLRSYRKTTEVPKGFQRQIKRMLGM